MPQWKPNMTHKYSFAQSLAEMQKNNKDLPLEWPGEELIQRLVEFAAGSFICAKMVVEMVKLRPGWSPVSKTYGRNREH